eukprot:TRINITY_DN6749_c0_g2_i1.p1 TRINITY_DN6749_c0_g2~~TRINITY_DN6749_c0_g2_i1.p1  ORF type:complete len:559 (+),score=87.36 TRINITY_DN6749_c0_g2_i1:426-2102(+)
MNWYSNTIYRVSGWDGDEWHILWQLDSQVTVQPSDTSAIVSPPICPTSFPVDTILIEVARAGTLAYPEIDAISMTGSQSRAELALVDLHSSALTYVPDTYKNGNDSISYSVNRCINYARYRSANARTGVVNISIASVNQAPTLATNALLVDLSRNETSFPFEFRIGASDVDNTTLRATAVQLPQVGVVRNAATGAVLQVGTQFDANELLLYVAPACLNGPDLTYNVTMKVRVTDGQLSVEGDVHLMVDCVSNVRRVSRGVEGFVYAISAISCVICLAFIGLVTVWRHKRSIQKISPLFCALSLVGALMIDISPIFLTWTSSSCMAWLCFFTLGLTIFLGAIAAKTYRIDRIFNSEHMKVFAIPNWLLLAYVSVLTGAQIVMLIIWGVLLPSKLSYIPVPRESYVVHACHSGDNWVVIAGVEYAFFILLFCFCAVFAWRVRKIPLTLSNVFWYDPTAKIAVIAASTCFSSTISIFCLFITKFFAIAADKESSDTSQQSKSTTNSGTFRKSSAPTPAKATSLKTVSTQAVASNSSRSRRADETDRIEDSESTSSSSTSSN